MYIGIDLGGTNIAVGIVDDSGKIIHQLSTPTLASRPAEEIIKDMAETAKKTVEQAGMNMADIKAVGIGSPGSVDNENGEVVYSNNLPFYHTKMRDEMQKYIDLPVNLENDANAAAYGEYIAMGHGVDSFVAITLGTGVGGGIILNGKIYRGFNGAGAELGHFTLVHDGENCTCGKPGCWEAYASVTALIRQTRAAMDANPQSIMHKMAQEEGKISGRTAFTAAKSGDTAAQAVVDKYIAYVADGITSIINIFQPDMLVIGGGISKEGDYLLKPIIDITEKFNYNKELAKTDIRIATLFNDAGIIGAALAARQ